MPNFQNSRRGDSAPDPKEWEEEEEAPVPGEFDADCEWGTYEEDCSS